LKIAQYNISRHMKELKNAGLVQERKDGKFVFYALAKPEDKVHTLILKAVEAFDQDVLDADQKRLKERLNKRVEGKCVVGSKWRCC